MVTKKRGRKLGSKMKVRLPGTLASAVSTRRLKMELSQIQLAAKAGVSMATIATLEQGRVKNVSLSTMRKIAHALEITDVELLREVLPDPQT